MEERVNVGAGKVRVGAGVTLLLNIVLVEGIIKEEIMTKKVVSRIKSAFEVPTLI